MPKPLKQKRKEALERMQDAKDRGLPAGKRRTPQQRDDEMSRLQTKIARG